MKLIVAEKPNVAQAIASVVGATKRQDGYIEGNDYIVTWCFGHLVSLSSPEKYDEKYKMWSLESLPIIPENWKFEVSSTTSKQFKVIKTLMTDDKVDEVICATDADREGECIFRYVYNKAGCKKPFTRFWVSSMEADAIQIGMNNLKSGHDYDNLYSAGLCRAKADWLVGMNATRLYTTLNSAGVLSVGRVQTPLLNMIVKRDYDVEHFVKQKYYTVDLNCGNFIASSERIDELDKAKQISENCNGAQATITALKTEVKSVNSPKLYDLTTMQRDANKYFGYTAQQTLDYAQSLYDVRKLITYPRTDSNYLTESDEKTALSLISTIYSVIPEFEVIDFKPNLSKHINNAKANGHPAILPTNSIKGANLSELPKGELNILRLVMSRLLQSAAPTHKYESVKATVECCTEQFFASGKTVIENGWKSIEEISKAILKEKNVKDDFDEESTTNKLPTLCEGQVFENVTAQTTEHFTSPPKAYTEDTLLKAMETAGNDAYDEDYDDEKKGIGTPATRAQTIETLVKRGYVERVKRKIVSTDKGKQLIEILPEEVKSPELTAQWETKLHCIEKGSATPDEFIANIEQFVKKLCSESSSSSALTLTSAICKCPKCGRDILDTPKAYSCQGGKGECNFVVWKTISKAKISLSQVKKLIENGKTDLIKGFVSKSGNKFEAYLILDNEQNVKFEFKPKGKRK